MTLFTAVQFYRESLNMADDLEGKRIGALH